MKLWGVLSDATKGWLLVMRGKPEWQEHFSLSAPGLVTAFLVFALAAFIALIFASMSIGVPSLPGFIAAMFVLALPILAFWLSLLTTRSMLKTNQPILPLMVPGIYALTAFLLIEGLLAMLGGPIVVLSWIALGFVLFRLARAATGWNVGVASCFAVFTVLLLVALRLALYMLSSSAGITI
ncbi:hypothetical protein [Devosia submarina]|uniref:hypothetical protein n=1 Tax=Devosia submarina TaxID=1173082 RepID=UPI000D3A8C10|nr:hypothetical protein [Devosia submarina]